MKLLCFDTETTGLTLHPDADLALQPQVIEFGAGLFDAETGDELANWSLLINPGTPLPAIITEITGITDAMLADKPPFAEVWPSIKEAFAAADVLVAHNAPFDVSLIDFELRRMKATDFDWPLVVCTVQENFEDWGRRPKLLQLFENLTGAPLAQTHRALDDVRALAACVHAMGLFRKDAP